MIQISNLKKTFGDRVLFENITFSINKNERVGLVGRNGSGKSTLIKIILNQESYDSGSYTLPQNYKLGHLEQHISFTEDTVLNECMKVLPKEIEHESYRAKKILFGLGFNNEDMEKAPTVFSGGFQLRINLTKCLLQDPNLLLLDEPTNYLDIVSLNWLKKFIINFPGEVLIITHDREFMDSVTTHTMGIHRKSLMKTSGDSEKYYEQLALEDDIYEKTRANQQKKVDHLQKFIDRFGAKATKATQAQSVAKKIAKMSILKQLDSEQLMGFKFNYEPTQAKRFLETIDLSFGFNSEPLFSHLTFDMKQEDRVGIIGKNGKGKSTLLNLLAGNLTPLSGSYTFHPTVKKGYYQQTHRKDLKPSWSIEEEITSANPKLTVTDVRSICGSMMFPGDDANKKISVLSGGEQSRVLLGKVIAHASNFLMLDEPTNHLDMESIEFIIEEIDSFPGPVIFVTHSEQMLRRLATKLVVFKNNGCHIFNGTYEDFLEKEGWEEENINNNGKNKSKLDQKNLKRLKAEIIQKRAKELTPLKTEMQKMEQEIMNIDVSLDILNKSVMEAVSDSNSKLNIQELYKEIGKLQINQERLYGQLEESIKKSEMIHLKFENELDKLK